MRVNNSGYCMMYVLKYCGLNNMFNLRVRPKTHGYKLTNECLH